MALELQSSRVRARTGTCATGTCATISHDAPRAARPESVMACSLNSRQIAAIDVGSHVVDAFLRVGDPEPQLELYAADRRSA